MVFNMNVDSLQCTTTYDASSCHLWCQQITRTRAYTWHASYKILFITISNFIQNIYVYNSLKILYRLFDPIKIFRILVADQVYEADEKQPI